MKIIKNPVFMFILGVVTCTITTVLASSLIASNISYTPQDKTWGVTNVGAALDSLMLSKTSDNYSTDEKVVGTWIDGKPLYQKTISFTVPSGSPFEGNVTDIDINNAENLNIVNGYVNQGHEWNSLNTYYTSNCYIYTGIRYESSNNKYYLRMKQIGWNNKPAIITIQYTKTTD